MQLEFWKYHGIGNDFIVCQVDAPETLSVARAVQLCDRHFGIGADGVLLVSPSDSQQNRAKMTVINADGSQPEMCGNGLRCVALFLEDQAAGGSGKAQGTAEFVVETDAGPRHCSVDASADEVWVTTSLGIGQREGSLKHLVDGQETSFSRISMGNPHAITFRDAISHEELDRIGAAISGALPGGTNVEIATVEQPTRLRVDVWERGVGRTLACGTGAGATAVAAIDAGHSPAGTPIEVHLPGGPLHITVDQARHVTLRGPAAFVFGGTVSI